MRKLVSICLTVLILVTWGCASHRRVSPLGETTAVVLTTDYVNSSQLEYFTSDGERGVLRGFSSDSVAVNHGGYIFVLERGSENKLDVVQFVGGELKVVREFELPSNSNPQDLELVGGKAYISFYNLNEIYVVNPFAESQEGFLLKKVDLTQYADEDGYGEFSDLETLGGYLVIAAQRLDRGNYFAPRGSSLLLVLSTDNDSLVDVDPEEPGVQGISLPASNPYRLLRSTYYGGVLVDCVGNWGTEDGAVYLLSPDLKLAKLVDETVLGGDVLDVSVSSDGTLYAAVSDPDFNTKVVVYHEGEAEVLLSRNGFNITDVEWSGSSLVVSDRTSPAGIYTVDEAGTPGDLHTTDLPPLKVIFVDPSFI